MAAINPYLNFNGNCEEAFDFYRSVFGGDFTAKMRFGDMPPGTPRPEGEDQSKQIMHVSLPIGEGTILMGSDTLAAYGKPIQGDCFTICITARSEDEANKLFGGLSAGGKVTMPIAKTFWGAYFGMLTDKFGVQWMVDYTSN